MIEPIPYKPILVSAAPWAMQDAPTAWRPNETVLMDIIRRFRLLNSIALDMGVDWGFSTSALASFFHTVIGVDTFEGDAHAGERDGSQFHSVRKSMDDAGIRNVILIRSDAEQWMQRANGSYSLIHVDLYHTFELTHKVGTWAVNHAPIVLFHDTRSFPEVMRAVSAVAEETGRHFYEWNEASGLGILADREIGDL